MKRLPLLITASFIIISILISSFPISASAEDYPYQRYFAYWRASVDGVNWITVTVTPEVTQTGMTFAYPSNIGTNQVNRLQFYLLTYSSSATENYPGITSIDGNISFYTDNALVDISNVNIEVANQVWVNNSWLIDGLQTISNNASFQLQPNQQLSARIRVDISNFNIIGYVRPYIRFNSLSINDHDIVNEAVYQGKIADFEQDVSDVVLPLETAEQQVVDDLNNIVDSVPYESVLPDLQSALEDFYTDHQDGSTLYASYFTTLWTDSFISPLIAVISLLAILGFVFFGRAF